jgi:hypothetical protein
MRGWAYWNFSNQWDMSQEELDQLNETLMKNNARLYPGNAHAYQVELHREQLVRLISDGTMSGYVACFQRNQGAGPPIFGYCNCGAKEKYKGLPFIWRDMVEPESKRVLAITELFVEWNFFCDCGLEEKLLTHAMEKAKEQGFTHAQSFLWECGYVDGDGNNMYDHYLTLYTSLGFTVRADLSDEYWRTYILEKEL